MKWSVANLAFILPFNDNSFNTYTGFNVEFTCCIKQFTIAIFGLGIMLTFVRNSLCPKGNTRLLFNKETNEFTEQ